MSPSTRRRLTMCLVIGLVALPAEAVLFPVAKTPDPGAAAVEWVADRSMTELELAASEIDAYPVVYRRAIMARLDPAARSETWRAQFRNYLTAHPELNDTQVFILHEAIELASPETFQPPVSPERQARLQQVFGEAQLHLGGDVAKALFVNLGPTTDIANALPLRQRVADRIRAWRTVTAGQGDCNCNPDIDTCTVWPESSWLECSELFSCEFDTEWPMCGPLWAWACTGWCRIVENQ